MSSQNQKKNPFSHLAASCIKNPFSKKVRDRDQEEPSEPDKVIKNSGEAGDGKQCVETSVAKIMKLIPGLSRADRSPSRPGHVASVSASSLKLIDVTPPSTKKVRESSRPHKKTSSATSLRKGDAEIETSSHSRSRSKDGKRGEERVQVYQCVNVKVSGPMYLCMNKILNHQIRRVVTLAGAGMSTAAGIPDFRSPDSGIYHTLSKYNLPYPQAVFERKYFNKNPKPLYRLLREMLLQEYRPTKAHYFVKLLEEKGLLLRHITQNVDGLERLAGISADKVVEAHGSVYSSRCLKCKKEYDLAWLRDRLVTQGKSVPRCQDPNCLGTVKPNIVLFGETLDHRFVHSVKHDVPRCDLLVVLGTSLVVEPFASTVKKVSPSCPRMIVNNLPVGEHLGIVYEGSRNHKRKHNTRDVFIQGSCDEGAQHLVQLFQWEKDLEDLMSRCEPCSPRRLKGPRSGSSGSMKRASHSSRRSSSEGKNSDGSENDGASGRKPWSLWKMFKSRPQSKNNRPN